MYGIVARKWLNSEPLTMQQLRGKVVLVYFWTYTCGNCINTLPYVKDCGDKDLVGAERIRLTQEQRGTKR